MQSKSIGFAMVCNGDIPPMSPLLDNATPPGKGWLTLNDNKPMYVAGSQSVLTVTGTAPP